VLRGSFREDRDFTRGDWGCWGYRRVTTHPSIGDRDLKTYNVKKRDIPGGGVQTRISLRKIFQANGKLGMLKKANSSAGDKP